MAYLQSQGLFCEESDYSKGAGRFKCSHAVVLVTWYVSFCFINCTVVFKYDSTTILLLLLIFLAMFVTRSSSVVGPKYRVPSASIGDAGSNWFVGL